MKATLGRQFVARCNPAQLVKLALMIFMNKLEVQLFLQIVGAKFFGKKLVVIRDRSVGGDPECNRSWGSIHL